VIDDTCKCDVCQAEIEIGAWPYCPHGTPSLKVIQDSIPGGLWIENMGHEPVKVYSKSEKRLEMEKRGLVESVRHVGTQDGDRSPHTSRWV
jgi:hypothetical protein